MPQPARKQHIFPPSINADRLDFSLAAQLSTSIYTCSSHAAVPADLFNDLRHEELQGSVQLAALQHIVAPQAARLQDFLKLFLAFLTNSQSLYVLHAGCGMCKRGNHGGMLFQG